MSAEQHEWDEDCQGHIVDDVCQVCGAYHGEVCPGCGGRGYHTTYSCPEMECGDHDTGEKP